MELQEPVAPMLREKSKQPKLRGKSTEAEPWGGPTRMSDEGPVMGLEQRCRVRWSHLAKQLENQDELDACDKQGVQYR